MSTSYPNVFHPDGFRGRVYGITGSGHGIGESTAKWLASLGALTILIERRAKSLDRVKADLQAVGAQCHFVLGDVARPSVINRAIEGGLKKFGRIDGWVNNAAASPGGVFGQPDSLAALRRTLQVNIEAAWNACELLAPIMQSAGGGSIVNISTNNATYGSTNDAAYRLSKSGLEGMTRALATDLAPHRIRVNTIAPGSINTHHPLRHSGQGVSPKGS